MSKKIHVTIAFLALISGCTATFDKPIKTVEQVHVSVPTKIEFQSNTRPLALDSVMVYMEKGAVIGENRQGIMCIMPKPRIWGDSEPGIWVRGQYHDIFKALLKEYNFNTPEIPKDSLFSEYKPTGQELIVRAKITDISENYCSAIGDSTFSTPSQTVYKGSVKFSVYWEVYSLSDKKVIYKNTTFGSAVGEKFKPSGEHQYFKTAFGNALKNLLSQQDFIKMINSDESRKKTL